MVLVTGCAAGSGAGPRALRAVPAGLNLAEWLADHPLAQGQAISLIELDRTDAASRHIVQILDREALHVHQRHDLWVRVERGAGTLRLGSATRRLQAGSVVTIPRGVAHSFVNESAEPAVALVVFTPPFDGADTVLVYEHSDTGDTP